GIDRRHRGSRAGPDRETVLAEEDRPRPPGSRPPVLAGLNEDPARARMDTDDRVRPRSRGDGRLVQVASVVVGAAQGARGDRRVRVDLTRQISPTRPLSPTMS